MEKQAGLTFLVGLKDGTAIALGYLSVSFTFGMMAISMGIPLEVAVIISLTNLTSAGQFAALDLLVVTASYTEMALTQFMINIRYALMSLSLSQKVAHNTTTKQRMLMSYGITDEIFALAAAQPQPITAAYFCGLMLLPIGGWTLGTWLGGAAATLLPLAVRNAMGFAIYGMFLAILIPSAKKHASVRTVILCAALLSCGLTWLQEVIAIGSGFSLIICTLLAAAYGAWRYPVKKEKSQ